MLSQKLSTSTLETSKKHRRFALLSFLQGRRYLHLASSIDLSERESESGLLKPETLLWQFCLMPNLPTL